MKLPRFLRRSIRRKVTALAVTSTFCALLLTAIGLGYYTVRDYNRRKILDMRTQAEIVARACAPALTFNDPREATRDLETLRAKPGLESVALYGADGSLFTAYSIARDAGPAPPRAGPVGVSTQGGHITIVYPIVEDGRPIGTLVLKSLYEVKASLTAYLLILGTVMACALVAAIALSSWLQGTITVPILRLADSARRVMERRDFTVRAGRTTDDEIGDLAEAVNRMLADLEREIDDRRGAEERLRGMDRRKDEFLATLAHELRNPLASIQYAVQVMQLKSGDANIVASSRAIIARQVKQLVRLIDDLMDLSRITTGKLSLRREPTDLLRVAMAAVEAIEPAIQSNGHHLTLHLPPPHTMIHADAARLEQVFLNLLSNAAKFMKPGGTVEFSLEVVDGEVIGRVRDNGIGISPDMLEAIFEMFTQVDRRPDRTASGLGIGLSISRTLVELHGGTLEARSAGPGQGTEFIIRLPAGMVPPSSKGVVQVPATGAGGRLRILIVDDNADFADPLAVTLDSLGHEVRIEYDGLAGLAAAETFRPELALLDIGMPKLDGYELAKRLRALPATGSCRLVAVTGWGQAADRRRSREAGFDEHLVKPVPYDQLLGLLARLAHDLQPRGAATENGSSS